MARISGVIIPDHKRSETALTYIYGVGPSNSRVILRSAGIDLNKRAKNLTAEEINKIQNIIDKNYKTEGELRREKTKNIQRLKEIGTWRGLRHARRLPLHGRSRTNSRTNRGNVRKTMGSGRKSAAEKT